MRRSLLGFSTIVASVCMAGCRGDEGAAAPQTTGLSGQAPPEAGPAAGAHGPNITVTFHPVDHTVAPDAAFFAAELTIENESNVTLGGSGWKIYFSFVRRILNEGEGNATVRQALAPQGVRFSHADDAESGDYLVLEPLTNFKPIAPGQKRVISLLAENWAVLKTDAPAGFHIAFGSGDGAWAIKSNVLLDANDPKQTMRFVGDVLPAQTPGLRFAENAALTKAGVGPEAGLLPTPQSVSRGGGQFRLGGPKVNVEFQHGLAREAAYLKSALRDVLEADVDAGERGHCDSAAVRLAIDSGVAGGPDAYTLRVDPKAGVEIVGASSAGVFYGIQTLRQLIPVDAFRAAAARDGKKSSVTLPEVTISDAPLFAYRGMALDVARHFQTKETVEKLLDLLAVHKINKLHLRLTDDEGWRLEIPGIPELTSFGARRGFDLAEKHRLHQGLGSSNGLRGGDHIRGKPRSVAEANGGAAATFQGFERATLNFVGEGDGFYTTRDFEEIVRYANERHVDVIPEIDVPGHARAAVMAMERRFAKFAKSDPVKASQYRLVDPDDTSTHTSVQGYTDNFVNPCLSSSYAFLDKVVHEIKARFDAAGAKLTMIHAGGDELPALGHNTWWQGSPACAENPQTEGLGDLSLRDFFFTNFQPIIVGVGAGMTGWDDIIHDGLEIDGFVPMPWSNVWGWGREDDAYKYANAGRAVILTHATNLYMDLAYNKDPDEPGYYWAGFVDEGKTFNYTPFNIFEVATHDRMGNFIPASAWGAHTRLNASARGNILGMQGLLFGENQKSPELVEYFAFPKILGVAERAWNRHVPETAADLPAAWNQFVNVLGQAELPRLDFFKPVDVRGELPNKAGVNYRIPLPGAEVKNGQLVANVRYPGFTIEYSTNGTTFVTYEAPVGVSGPVWVRAKSQSGRVGRTARVD